MIPSESDNRKASRCLPTSKTVVAKIGLIAVESTGTEAGVIIGVVVADEPHPITKAIVRTVRPDMNGPALDGCMLIMRFMALLRRIRM